MEKKIKNGLSVAQVIEWDKASVQVVLIENGQIVGRFGSDWKAAKAAYRERMAALRAA